MQAHTACRYLAGRAGSLPSGELCVEQFVDGCCETYTDVHCEEARWGRRDLRVRKLESAVKITQAILYVFSGCKNHVHQQALTS